MYLETEVPIDQISVFSFCGMDWQVVFAINWYSIDSRIFIFYIDNLNFGWYNYLTIETWYYKDVI